MKSSYPIQWLPATPEYILAGIQEEWRQFARDCELTAEDRERQMPTFNTTIRRWCDDAMLDEWMPLGQALNQTWGTKFTRKQWRQVLEPAREKTIRGVCELLATQAQRPLVPPAKILGHECQSAGVFLAIRSLLIAAGAPANLRPSSSVEPYLKKWPKVFQEEIDPLVLGGLPYKLVNEFWPILTGLTSTVGALLLVAGSISKVPETIIVGVFLFAGGWLGGLLYRGPLTLESANTFRDLVEIIVKKQRAYGFTENSK